MNLSVLPFSAVLFDLDNTLLDREAGFELFAVSFTALTQ